MFDALSDRLERISTRLRGKGRISDEDLDEALGEIRTALLDADVELSVARRFIDGIRLRVSVEALSKSLTPGQQVIKAVHEELVNVLGGDTLKLTYASRPPTVVLMAGLQGAGKTTTSAKLALWWKQQGRNPMLVGADLQRPAAVEQLRVLGQQAGVTVFSEPTDPVRCAQAGLEEARRLGRDICIVDTAGRLTIDAEMMDQIRAISAATQPHYTFLVIDSMIGQDAVATAKAFHDALELNGVILTKLDGDARGGAALSVKGVVGKPIAFASTGERLGDFDLFHPDRMADRILGMGDVLSLIEQAERTMDGDEVAKSASRLMAGQFTLEDFLSQLRQVKKMGSLGGLMRLMPGMNKEMREAAGQIDDGEVAKVEAIVCSMTPAERNDTTIMDGSRRSRVARGSGTSVQDVNALLKQFKEMQKMMKGMASGNMPNLPGMPNMSGMSGRAARKLAKQAGGLGGAGPLAGAGAAGAGQPDFDMLSQLIGDGDGAGAGAGAGGGAGGTGLPAGFPGLPPAGASPKPVVSVNKGTKKKKKGGRVTPPKSR
ncbi:MAG TPA: signal recognition particle protein [Acidimicrobiales bacterium]|nr:signal recognition particle protein [Acidimicrobiales bacterium]